MFEHLQYKGSTIATKTPAGRQAESQLDFNDPDSVEYRQLVLDLIVRLERDVRELTDTIDAIEEATKRDPSRAEEFESEIQAIRGLLARARYNLARVSGPPL